MTDASPRRQRLPDRQLITPEGVPLRLQVAGAGPRFAALCVDAGIILTAAILTTLVSLLAAGVAGGSAAEAISVIWLIGVFALRNAYFLVFELSPRAATPGKRLLGLRVAARNGGPLKSDAVFVRNAMRELELFLPVMLLAAAPRSGGDGWVYVAGTLWCAVFAFLPLFNRDRLRAGDIVAGTWVLKTPKASLLGDMADQGAERAIDFAFSTAQLDVYGVKELQVLEHALRTNDRMTLRAIADRVAAKIGHDLSGHSSSEFLSAYYHAARGQMEGRLLMGRSRRDKIDGA